MISALILTKNEQKNIIPCLKSLLWCDEIIVVDDFSQDKTVEIIKKFKIKVYKRHLKGDFAAQRNFALEQAQGEWLLFVDADERVSLKLRKEIVKAIKKPEISGFYLKRQDFFQGQALKHGETARVRLLRLARKKAGSWQRPVHEIWQVQGRKGELKNPLEHYPHQTISEFLESVNFHSDLHAQALEKEGVKPAGWRIVFQPLAKFIFNYFLCWGFLDRMPGLITAMMMSLHSFLAQGKLYLKWKK